MGGFQLSRPQIDDSKTSLYCNEFWILRHGFAITPDRPFELSLLRKNIRHLDQTQRHFSQILLRKKIHRLGFLKSIQHSKRHDSHRISGLEFGIDL